VKKRFFYHGIVLVILLVFVISSLTFAANESIVRIQGKVMELDLKKNIMIVNERMFFWGQNTNFYDDKGFPITADRLRTKGWVYIEASRQGLNKKVVAERIFLLPKYIDEKEKHLYPFIQ
jgi:hypothetical protein